MTTHDSDDSEGSLVVEGRREVRTTHQPTWTILLRPLQAFIGMLPSHKDTRRGRKTARQIRIVVFVVGLITIFASESNAVFLFGIAIAGLAPWFPISQSRQRTWLRTLKRTREPRDATESRAVELRLDDDELTISADGETRRLPRDEDAPPATVGRVAGRLVLRVETDDGEEVWIAADGLEPDAIPDDWDCESFDDDADREPTVVDDQSWRRIAESLRR